MRYRDKATARKAVWDSLKAKRVARFPFPPHGRIPNFAGAREAAERLLAHPLFKWVRVVKVNPDSPQRWVRQLALERGITVIMPTPRLKGAFRVLDPCAFRASAMRRRRRSSAAANGARTCRSPSWRESMRS